MPSLTTPRLQLVPLTTGLLEALLKEDLRLAERLGGFRIPPGMQLRPATLRRRLEQLRREPDLLPWLLHGMVERSSGFLCGHLGFHSRPAPEDLAEVAPDGVELGYLVAPGFRRQGYASEAVRALLQWAFQDQGQRVFVLTISPDNTASLAMATSLGFTPTGLSQEDPLDGIEHYFVRRLDSWPSEWR